MRIKLVALALTACVATAAAAPSPDRRAKELAEIEQRLKDREADEKRLKNEAESRAKEVAALRYRMIETANSLQSAERRMREIGAELKRLEREEGALSASLKGEQESLADILGALQSLEMSKPPALLVSPDDANQAARAAMLLSDAAPVLESRARALRGKLERLTAVRRARDRERADFEKTSAEIAGRRRILAELLEKKQAERDVAASLAAAAQKETAALAARATSLREVIRRLKRLASSITPRLKPSPPRSNAPVAEARPASPRPEPRAEPFAPTRAFGQARGALRPPVVGRLGGAFGADRPDGGKFDGVRFAAPASAIVTAPFEGAVAFARDWGPIGNLIVLDVGGGYHILLMGVDAFLVQEGQRVAAGEPVGAMPAGADAVLDLEIRKNGEPVNPGLWLSKAGVEEMAF